MLTLDACSLITPLDFVGPKRSPTSAGAAGATEDDAGISSAGASTAAAGCVDEAGTAGVATSGGAAAGAGTASTNMAGASISVAGHAGATPAPDTCTPACGPSQICKAGICTCNGGKIACNGVCLDSLTEAGYCGKCGAVCRADQSCSSAGCVCQSGQTDCGTTCIDLASDPLNCGSCGRICNKSQNCIAGSCRTSPCDGVCPNPGSLTESSDGYRAENIGTGESCWSISIYRPTATVPRIACWNIETARTVRVNGLTLDQSCDNSSVDLQQQKQGWYCIQIGAGQFSWAGLLLPTVKP